MLPGSCPYAFAMSHRPPTAPDPAVPLGCEDEPIHRLGGIQPFGTLVMYDPDTLHICQVSGNLNTGVPAARWPGRPLAELLGAENVALLQQTTHQPFEAQLLLGLTLDGVDHEVALHRNEGMLVLEIEPADPRPSLSVFYQLNNAVRQLETAADVDALCQVAARALRNLVSFDRVLVYRFAADLHGQVVGEDHQPGMEPYLGLHYPAADIPPQARALYLRNRVRIIADVNHAPVPLVPAHHPATGQTTDLSQSTLRSVSPVHLEYLVNMGVRASLSVSVVWQGRLWGLLACHHLTPRHLPLSLRQAAELFGRAFEARLAGQLAQTEHAYQLQFRQQQLALLKNMTDRPDFVTALYQDTPNLLSLIPAAGAAVCFDGQVVTLGQTPTEEQIRQLVSWLQRGAATDVFHTHALAKAWPGGAALQTVASGVLALSVSQLQGDYLFWFRPEVSQTVRWAGQPDKITTDGGKRLSPRQSFATWQQQVQGEAEPWQAQELEAAAAFRTVVIGVVLKTAGELKLRADTLARLNAELARSNEDLDAFAFIASHDLKEPLRGIRNYAGFLLEDYREQLDEAGQDKLRTLVRLGRRMEELIGSLLEFSRVGRVDLAVRPTDLNQVVDDALDLLGARLEETGAQVVVPRPLPTLTCDAARVAEIFSNLIGNGIKYTDRPAPRLEIGCQTGSEGAAPVFYVRDDGIGIDALHHEEIFRIFKRLHARDDYGGGSGLGLTIVRKLVERHGGNIWLSSTPGRGTTFYFTLSSE